MSENEVKLKPCPFCGGEAELYEDDTICGGFVYCPDCRSVSVYNFEVEKAIEAWNREVAMTKEKAIEAWNREVAMTKEKAIEAWNREVAMTKEKAIELLEYIKRSEFGDGE